MVSTPLARQDAEREVERLQAQLTFIRRVVDTIPAMIAYWSCSQRCVFANRAYERWFGVTPDWLVGRTLEELLGAIYPLNLPYIEGALRGEPQHFERTIPDPLGGPPRHAQADYIPDVDGGVVRGFYVLVSDITERRALENDLVAARRAAEDALAHVKTLTGLLPICAWCQRIRNEDGRWGSLEQYVAERTDTTITHGMCEDCLEQRFPDRGSAT